MRPKGICLIGFGGVAYLAALQPVHAAEFCVTCEGPAAQYSCQFDDASATLNDSRLKLFCITELAKSGPHASCSVDRSRAAPCAGEARHLALPDGIEPSLPLPETQTAAPPPDAAPAAAPEDAPAATAPGADGVNQTDVPKTVPGDDASGQADAKEEAPPKTVQEMVEKSAESTGEALEKTGEAAKDAAKSTGSAIEKAGSAVGKAAKKTWNCITSFFGDC